MQASVISSVRLGSQGLCHRPLKVAKRQSLVVVWAEGQPENSGEAPPASPQQKQRSAYIDELPEIPRAELSPEMRRKLKQEYYSLGGSPNTAMGANWFLWISLFIGFLAVFSALTGAI